jgi:hypothetical protein
VNRITLTPAPEKNKQQGPDCNAPGKAIGKLEHTLHKTSLTKKAQTQKPAYTSTK